MLQPIDYLTYSRAALVTAINTDIGTMVSYETRELPAAFGRQSPSGIACNSERNVPLSFRHQCRIFPRFDAALALLCRD